MDGIDVWDYQGKIEWKMVRERGEGKFGIDFVFMKGWEGGDYGEKGFRWNLDWGKRYGFMGGGYDF